MKANVNKSYIPTIQEISRIIEDCRLFNIEKTKDYSALMNFLKERNEELNIEVRCEGHTDDAILPPQSEFRNNWELSSARSLKVVNIMNDASSIPEKYFSYNGYGEFRPLINVSGIKDFQKKKQARAYNRRVEIYLDAFARVKTRSSEDEFLKMMNDKFIKGESSISQLILYSLFDFNYSFKCIINCLDPYVKNFNKVKIFRIT